MGTQTAIVEMIGKKCVDYVLVVKENRRNLETDIRQYFEDLQMCAELRNGNS